MPRLLLLGVAAFCMTACAAGLSGPGPGDLSRPLASEVNALIEARDGIRWRGSRLLSWRDFQASAPTSGNEGALTSYNLLYGTRCARGVFTFDVEAVFLPKQSWVKPDVVARPGLSARTLRHEQTHFDLTEAYARRLRALLRGADRPCGAGAEALRATADTLVAGEAAAQRQYDAETRHGLDEIAQQAWNRYVGESLVELEDLADERLAMRGVSSDVASRR